MALQITANVSFAETCDSPGSEYKQAYLIILQSLVSTSVSYQLMTLGNQGAEHFLS